MIGDLLLFNDSATTEIAAVCVLLLSVLGLLGLTLAVLLWMAFVPERVQRWLFRSAPQAPPFYH